MSGLLVVVVEEGDNDFRNHLLQSWLDELRCGRDDLHRVVAFGIAREYRQRMACVDGVDRKFLLERMKCFLSSCVELEILTQTDANSLTLQSYEPTRN